MPTTDSWFAFLPLPPSVNHLYRNVPRRGRVKTGAYLAWERDAQALLKLDYRWPTEREPTTRRWEVEIVVYLSQWRRDIDNTLKPLIDLAARTLGLDDRYLVRIDALRAVSAVEGVAVEVREWEE